MPRSSLPGEWEWDALRSFDFVVGEMLSILVFLQKTEFRVKALKVARSKTDVERERWKKTRSVAVVKRVMAELFNPFLDKYRQYIKYVPQELLRHPTFKTDLVFFLACFDYGALFKFSMSVAVDCYQHVFQNFNSRGWLARELRNVHIKEHVEFVVDIRHDYLDGLGVAPAVEDLISFLSACPY